MSRTNEPGVSPVIGVMLMLVVTIIIAAVVSAFAGGMGSSQEKVPQVTLKAEYSQSEGMTIYHNGGDTLAIGDFKIFLTPSKNYYSIESDQFVSQIDQKLISNGESDTGVMWFDYKGGRQVQRFGPGDVAVINATNCYTDRLTPSMIYTSPAPMATPQNYGINDTQFVGATFFLDFTTKDGKEIARVEVPITP
jgi:FlaG/FlaF family flagellin (archaellin)